MERVKTKTAKRALLLSVDSTKNVIHAGFRSILFLTFVRAHFLLLDCETVQNKFHSTDIIDNNSRGLTKY